LPYSVLSIDVAAVEPGNRYNIVDNYKTNYEGIAMGSFGFWPLVHLALVIYAAVQIFGSKADTTKKIIWIVIVAVFPLVGLIVWFFIGPGTPRK